MTRSEVLAVSVGRTRQFPWRGRHVTSAIAKSMVDEAVTIGPLGLTGDEQGDRLHHGGPDKAVLAYAGEHYTAWSEEVGPLDYPAFGENLTTIGLMEHDVVLGAVYRIGTAVLQVSQPRQPCYKLAVFHQRPDMAVLTQQTGRVGIYFRVLTPGTVRAGDSITLLSRPEHGITAAETHRILNIDRHDREAARRLLAHPDVLPARWQRTLRKRLDGVLDNQARRLYGSFARGNGPS
ncbi:MOSC domain-containing protein [Mycolicibacterium thermoresistibile]